MTQYNDDVKKQQEVLDKEKEQNTVKSWELKIKDGKWTEETLDHASGKRIINYNDKRKNTVEEYHGEDVE